MPTHQPPPPLAPAAHSRSLHPYAAVLRQRAGRLRELARRIDGALVFTLDPAVAPIPDETPRTRLCESLLARNLHQLHRAADELRDRAFRFQARADELDRMPREAA